MSFPDWQKNGWLRPHKTSGHEIAGLLAVVERDLATSAAPKLDGDWRFAIAYNAALQCAALTLKAAGYEVPKAGGAHHHTIKRGGGIYETTGVASDTEIDELRALALNLYDLVQAWLKKEHANLLPRKAASGKAAKRNGGSSKNHTEPTARRGKSTS